jgi:GNAT superfamily N-acetyltransferase
MVLAPIPAAEKPCPEELSIEIIKTPEDLAVYANTMSEGFEMDPALLAPLNHPRTLRALDLKRYLGRVRGEPVATALRATVNRVAVLFNIVTLAPWRRRGFGEAITLRAAQEGLAEGCVASFLQSTMMGFPVYFRAGYRHVIDFHGWIPRGSRQS